MSQDLAVTEQKGCRKYKKGSKKFFKKRLVLLIPKFLFCWEVMLVKKTTPAKNTGPKVLSYSLRDFIHVKYKIIHMMGLWNQPAPTIMLRSRVVWSKAHTIGPPRSHGHSNKTRQTCCKVASFTPWAGREGKLHQEDSRQRGNTRNLALKLKWNPENSAINTK